MLLVRFNSMTCVKSYPFGKFNSLEVFEFDDANYSDGIFKNVVRIDVIIG